MAELSEDRETSAWAWLASGGRRKLEARGLRCPGVWQDTLGCRGKGYVSRQREQSEEKERKETEEEET